MIHRCWLPLVVLSILSGNHAAGEETALRLPAVFGDHMVIQRGAPAPIWGWGTAGQTVQVTLGTTHTETTVGEDGRWHVRMPRQESDLPLTLTIRSGEESVQFQDVLLGEVWICSGQSNMEWPLTASDGGDQVASRADQPKLRFFHVHHATAAEPQEDCQGTWQIGTPDSAQSFSAVGYYFGNHLVQALECPVGMLGTYWGGTPAEAWTSRQALEAHRELHEFVEKPNTAAEIQNQPSMLFNGMVNPIIPFGIRGAIWYQGESNVGRAQQYAVLFPTMIRDWRNRWREGDFPFYFVQLAPFRYTWADPTACAELWEAQQQTLSLPNTGLAATMDIGDVKDIHPRNKRDVGERLARWALAKTYHRKGVHYCGPMYHRHVIEGDTVRIEFDFADGLKTRDGLAPTEFTMAGPDGHFLPAEAQIEGNTVRVRQASIPEPAAVRFAWRDTAQPNLVNGADLPALPFRTDVP